MDKIGDVEIPFAWLFALVVGGAILFLAIFATTKITQTQNIAIDASTAKEIGILLNPLETGFETAKTTSINLPAESRIYNKCDSANGYFGRQLIRLSQKSFGKWTETDLEIGFSNKYIFSEEFVEGKKFYLFSKPFNFPFKVADVIYMTSTKRNYCFSDAPEDVKEEIENLNQANLYVEECPAESIEVCFSQNCDIEVNEALNYVEKRGEKMYFSDNSLMYAAIFSDPVVYECQLKRLMERGSQLSQLYVEKSSFISAEGCFTNANAELLALATAENNFESSANIFHLSDTAEDIGRINEAAICKLW